MFAEAELDRAFEHYHEHGWARVGVLAHDHELAGLRARVDDLMLGRVVYPGMFFQLDTTSGDYDDLTYGQGYEGPSENYRKIEKLEMDPLFWQWITHPSFVSLAQRAYGPRVAMYRAVVFNKAKTGGTYLPWHQDGGKFWGVTHEPVLQV